MQEANLVFVGGESNLHTSQTRFGLINALPGKRDHCILKAGGTPIVVGITNG